MEATKARVKSISFSNLLEITRFQSKNFRNNTVRILIFLRGKGGGQISAMRSLATLHIS